MLWVDDGGGKGHLQITITGDSTILTFENNSEAETVGLKTASILAYVEDENLLLESTDGQVLDVSASGMSSLASENFTLNKFTS